MSEDELRATLQAMQKEGETFALSHYVLDIDEVIGLTQRIALESRIDEISYLDDNYQVNSQDWERAHPGYSTQMIPLDDYINRRKELKAQLTNLDNSNKETK